jgi:uncharacterized protein involved in outer membrane biogenesis
VAITRYRLRRYAGIAVLVYAVYALAVVYLVPPIARQQVQKRLGAALRRPVTVHGIFLNPFTLRLTVQGLEVWEPDGLTPFAGASRIEVNHALLLSALQRGVVVSSVRVDGPHAIVVRRADGSFNFSDVLIPRGQAEPPEPAASPAAAPLRFSVSNIQIREGWFFLRDEGVGAQQRLTRVDLALPAVSSLPNHTEIYVKPAFRARLNGRELVLDSQAKPFAESREGTLDLRLHGLDLTAVARYLPEPRNVDLTSGWLDIDLQLKGRSPGKQTPSLVLSGELGLREVCLTGRDGLPMVSVGALRVGFRPADLVRKEVHLSRIECSAPFLRLSRDADGALVLPRLGAESATTATPAAAPGAVPAGSAAPPMFTADVDEILVQDGRLEFADASVSPTFQTQLGFQVEASGLSTRPERPFQLRIETASEAGEVVAGTYEVTLFPQLGVNGSTTVTDVRLPKYMPYLNQVLASAITRGTLSLSVEHALVLPAGASPVVKVTDLDLVVSDFCLSAAAAQAPVVSIRELTVADVALDLGAREAVVGRLGTRGGELRVERAKDGSLNLQKLVRAGPAPAALAPPSATPAPAAAAEPWTVTLRELAVADWALAVEDQQPGTPVRLAVRDIGIEAKDLSTRPGQKATVALGLKLNQSAALAVRGSVGMEPLAAELSVTLTELALKDFQGYVSDHLKLLINDGALEADLKLAVGAASSGGFAGTVDGMVALRRFACVDTVKAEPFVACRELVLRGIHVDLEPLAVRLAEVALSGLETAVSVRPDGSLNLLAVLPERPPEPAATQPPTVAAAAPGGSGFPLEIAVIRLDGCALVFTDQQSSPHYRLSLDGLAGTVSGLSLARPTPAQIELAARLDGHAPLTLQATLTDLGPRLTLTAATVLKDFDLSPLSPYSGRYVGYGVQKGKLNFDLRYALTQRQLVAEHKLLIDQFAFGQKVESPDATDLPVRLAVALLKDRRGQIGFDVPVKGSLDDPQFSVLRIVLKVLRDLVAKAATAPFAMLGALVGGGEELSFVDFAPGSAELDESGAKKLALLAQALADRPELQVETGGTADPVTDREALARQAVLGQVRARKLADLVKAGAPAPAVAEIVISEAEHAALLRALYLETLAPPPAVAAPAPAKEPAATAAVTPAPEPTPAEIEAQLAARVTVTDEELTLLAGRRAARVREFLTTTGQIASERVFVVDRAPPTAAGSGSAATAGRQVRLALR